MKRHLLLPAIPVAAVLICTFISHLPQTAVGDDPLASQSAKEAPVDWKTDPTCRMVFFAVLEGLYTDGVPASVVESLVPKVKAEGGNALKANFVVECPLCHPVYEALVQYRDRSAFRDSKLTQSTFGNGLTKKECEALTSESRMTRLQALRPLVRKWVDRRMKMMRLTKEEQDKLTAELLKRSQQGKQKLMSLMRNDPAYHTGWSMYWGCAACNGATDACRMEVPHQHKTGD